MMNDENETLPSLPPENVEYTRKLFPKADLQWIETEHSKKSYSEKFLLFV